MQSMITMFIYDMIYHPGIGKYDVLKSIYEKSIIFSSIFGRSQKILVQ